MQYTTNYNLNLPEGTDVVNPLVQDNPNYTAIDAAMFANKQAVIGSASELTSGTAHAITRSNTDSNYFRFTATSNWTAGDTMTVDGVTVTLYLTDGQTPATGAYVINSEVLCLLAGTRVTLISSGKQTAAQTVYSNSTSGLAATDVQGAIDEIDSTVDSFYASFNSTDPSIDYINGDANDITKSGVYRMGASALNIPVADTCILYQLGGYNARIQICRPYYPWDHSYALWYRAAVPDNGSFDVWKRITLS